MNRSQDSAAKLPVYGSKEGLDVSIILQAKAVVEKNSFVATGIVNYVHGEIMEIEVDQAELFKLGEPVKLIIYSSAGLFVFESTVIAKEIKALIIIHPPENRKKFNDKRDHMRVGLVQPVRLLAFHQTQGRGKQEQLAHPVMCKLLDISMGGMGLCFSFDLGFKAHAQLEIELELGFTFGCTVEIIRVERSGGELFYGTRYSEIPEEVYGKLRAFVLKLLIEDYYRQKKHFQQQKLLGEAAGGGASTGAGAGEANTWGAAPVLGAMLQQQANERRVRPDAAGRQAGMHIAEHAQE